MSDEMIRCPQCGHENRAGDHFCSNCGTRLLRQKPNDPEPEAADPDPYAPASVSDDPIFASDVPKVEPFPSTPPPSSFPPPVTPTFLGDQGQSRFGSQTPGGSGDEDDASWRMSSLGPPPKPKRRLWLWIVVGLLAFCILVCIGLAIFFNTGTGQDWLGDIGTRVAEEATKQANPTSAP